MTPLYDLRGITRCHGARTVLAVEHLALEVGRLYTLTGANGAGKSTLLQILAFLTSPAGGELRFRGEPVVWGSGALRRLRQEATLLHQAPYLFGTSVFANVAFGLKTRGIRGEAQRRQVEEALDQVGLAGFGPRRARELSGGEAQRVAMARALALRPAVLLLDEPFANVDRQSAAILEGVIGSLPAAGTTVILTTHDPLHPDRLGSETIHLEAGRLATSPIIQQTGKNGRCQRLPKPAGSFSTASLPSA
jgi:tungstate transport system ATP-binding protein